MTSLLVGLLCFALHVAVTLVWLRLPGRTSPVARHAVSALGTNVVVVALAAYRIGSFAYWPAAAVSGFGAVCWLFAFSAVYKSVSLRILTQLDRVPDGALPLDAITKEHVRPEFAARAMVLVKMNCVEEAEDGYVVTEKGTGMACRVGTLKRICGVGESGLYGNCQQSVSREPEASASPLRSGEAFASGSRLTN